MRKELLKSLQEINVHEHEEFDQQADEVKSHEETILVIENSVKIIRSKKKYILNVASRKGNILKDLKFSERI